MSTSVLAAVLLQSGCAAPHASPEAIQRLDPAALAGIESARQPTLPLSLDEVVARSRAGQPSAALIDEIRRTGTRHPISPSEAVRLKAQGVAPEVLDALDEAHQRWARDEAAGIVRDDPRLQRPAHARLLGELRRRFHEKVAFLDVG